MDYIEIVFEVSPKFPFTDILVAEICDLGFDTFEETETGTKAYIPAQLYNDELMTGIEILNHSECSITWTKTLIPAQNWNAVWESSFDPVIVQNCCIRAPFHNKPADVQFDIIIEPKMSFGTGHHFTTALVVEMMLQLDFQQKSVLDMGCGTGILAILAAKMGANDLLAIDIDEWAYENTIENIDRNQSQHIVPMLGGAELLTNQSFDVIIANINRNILTRDMGQYAQVAKSGCRLLLSGFLDVDIETITESAVQHGFVYHSHQMNNHWTAMSFIKK